VQVAKNLKKKNKKKFFTYLKTKQYYSEYTWKKFPGLCVGNNKQDIEKKA